MFEEMERLEVAFRTWEPPVDGVSPRRGLGWGRPLKLLGARVGRGLAAARAVPASGPEGACRAFLAAVLLPHAVRDRPGPAGRDTGSPGIRTERGEPGEAHVEQVPGLRAVDLLD